MTVTFDKIWRQYEKELTAFVSTRLFDKSLASDVMQEVAIKIYKNQHKLESIENSRAWLYRLTRNTLIDFYKKNDTAITSELYNEALTINQEEDDSTTLNSCLRDMMSTLLSKTDNEILHLSIIEQYSLREISTRLNLSIEGTKTKLKRAKKKLSSQFFSCCNLEKDSRGNILECLVKIIK